MKYISHRGNVYGYERGRGVENTIDYILDAIALSYDVEIDLWYMNDKLYLGHDEPGQETSIDFLLEYNDKLWCHAKDIKTFHKLLQYDINTFFHNTDDCALTSKGYLWTYFDKELTDKSILLKFEKDEDFIIPNDIYGICSDNIDFYKNKK